MQLRFWNRLLPKSKQHSWVRSVVSGSLYRLSDIRGDTDVADIKTQIDTMRSLARDSQISTALSYYATDATTVNTAGDVIWAVPKDRANKDVAEVVNDLLKRWQVNKYARDHILELATIGNLYLPTTMFYNESVGSSRNKVALNNNTLIDEEYDIVPSSMIPPEDVLHLWYRGKPQGYVYSNSDENNGESILFPEGAIIHFALGGLLGKYEVNTRDKQGQEKKYDIQFAQPLMDKAVQPTQTLSLLEDALLLSSLTRVVRFVNVNCGNVTEEDEVRDALQQIKDMIETQLSINTNSGDVQSFVNPQSPNNLIYVPKINGEDPISVTDLNMQQSTEQDDNLLKYYQDKKLSVLGVPKEAMNFSSSEGLGGAGQVMSQRSALYANALQRLETAYISGWTTAINLYFENKNLSGFKDQFELKMQPIITLQSTVQFEKRDSALSQATTLVDMLKTLNVTDKEDYLKSLSEILSEVFPQMGSESIGWKIDVSGGGEQHV